MPSFYDALKSLLPDGHAFRLASGSSFQQLIEALSLQPDDVASFFENVRDAGMPGRIPAEALGEWEELYGLQNNSTLSDAERDARIKSKYNIVGGQGVDYLQSILQEQFGALSTQREYNNTCGNPGATCGNTDATCGNYNEHAGTKQIKVHENIDSHDPSLFAPYLIVSTDDDDNSDTFFIPGSSHKNDWPMFWFVCADYGLGSIFYLDSARKLEFTRTILQLKPAHTWVIARVRYI